MPRTEKAVSKAHKVPVLMKLTLGGKGRGRNYRKYLEYHLVMSIMREKKLKRNGAVILNKVVKNGSMQ